MSKPRHTCGFTLLELLLATVLSTVLMLGVMAVIADLGSARAGEGWAAVHEGGSSEASERGVADETFGAFVRLLREDLSHATRVKVAGGDELTLWGYAGLDGRARERTQRPVRVRYAVVEIANRPWLVRRQAVLDVLTNQNVQRDLVCRGITRLELVPIENKGGFGRRESLANAAGSQQTTGPSSAFPETPSSSSNQPNMPSNDERKTNRREKDGRPRQIGGLYLHRGEYLPPSHLPDDVRDRIVNGEDPEEHASQSDESLGDPADVSDGGGGESSETEEDQERGHSPGGWRLRLWVAGSDEPAHQQTLLMR